MAFALPAIPLRMTDANGNVLAGAKMNVYLAGTTTPTDFYTTSALSVAHANPLVADSGGLFDEAFFAPGTYKLRFTTSANVTVFEIDNYSVEADGAQFTLPIASKTGNFTVTEDDAGKVFLCDSSGTGGLNLICTADSDTLGQGFTFTVVNTGASGTITVQGVSAQTIDGSASLTISNQNAAASFVSKGAAGWQTTGKSGVSATTTEVLTGTSTALAATPDAIAALWEKGTAVAGGSTITLGEGGYFRITGSSWTCSDFDFSTAKDGRTAYLYFEGSGTITHNATTLLCEGGRDIKVRAGTRCVVSQDNTDNIVVFAVSHADKISGCDLLSEQNASSSATIDIDLVSWSEYKHFEVRISNLAPVTDATILWMRVSTNSGSSYDTGATDYIYYANNAWILSSANAFSSTGAAQIVITDTVGNVSGEYVNAKIEIDAPALTRNATFRYSVQQRNQTGGNLQQHIGVAERVTSQDITNVRFLMSSGNISSGNFRLYGYR